MNGSVERKSLHAFNLIRFEAIRITIWPKRTKIALIFFCWRGGGGEIEHYADSITDAKLQPPKFGHEQRAKFCFPFLLFHLFSVFFGGKRFCENSKSPEIISEKVRLGGRKHFFVWNFL